MKKFPVKEVVESLLVSFTYCGLMPLSTVSSCVTASVWKYFERSAYRVPDLEKDLVGLEVEVGHRSLLRHERRPELAPVVASRPVAFVMYCSYAALKKSGSVKLSSLVIPGTTCSCF